MRYALKAFCGAALIASSLEAQEAPEIDSVVISATRGERRVQDEPLRVEVLGKEEVEEKLLMTPGDITMMLNETSGLRVQTTSASLGASALRVQGLRGRYTQVLSDGLPLFGGQVGGLGLLQIPPMDLGGVEIIKGVASSLYGSAALGGVINLLSRRPASEPVRELLANQTTLNGSDLVAFDGRRLSERSGYTLLLGGHRQSRVDRDSDGWSDMPGYRRFVLRPRGYWSGENGSNAMVTVGTTLEDREGGTEPGSAAPDGSPFPEELRTRRFDAGAVSRFIVPSGIVSVRGSASRQGHRHQFGDNVERDSHMTWFGEAAYTAVRTNQSIAVGVAMQQERYRSRDVPRFDYVHSTPSLFGQLTRDVGGWFSVTASARADRHSEYGGFLSPRMSALARLPGGWTVRASGGAGYYAPSPFTEETEATGLRFVEQPASLRAERARSGSLDVGGLVSGLEVNATIFGSRISHPIIVRAGTVPGGRVLSLDNGTLPTRTGGAEALVRWKPEPFSFTATYTYVRSTEQDPSMEERRQRSPLVPAHQAGIVAMFEQEGQSRLGVEVYYTGRQTLEDNPYRGESRPYVHVGVIAERRFGRARIFVNAENLLDVRQTKYDPLVLPFLSHKGRWTTDVWAPLDGRVANVGVRFDLAR
jgi:outer membrane receptor for ferrienterochelin and colicins